MTKSLMTNTTQRFKKGYNHSKVTVHTELGSKTQTGNRSWLKSTPKWLTSSSKTLLPKVSMTFENHATSWEQSMRYFTFTTIVWRYFVFKCRNRTQALEHNGIAPLPTVLIPISLPFQRTYSARFLFYCCMGNALSRLLIKSHFQIQWLPLDPCPSPLEASLFYLTVHTYSFLCFLQQRSSRATLLLIGWSILQLTGNCAYL